MCSEDRPRKVTAEVIVKVQEDPAFRSKDFSSLKTPKYPSGELESPAVIIVRAEEILILCVVLLIWIGAIMLFFNRWGKIRMLEPYQPLFMDTSQRPSCNMASVDNLLTSRPRMSLSKYNVSCDIPMFNVNTNLKRPSSRPRLHSVFDSSSSNIGVETYSPRRTKSAVDVHSVVAHDMYILPKTKSTPIRPISDIRKQSLSTSPMPDKLIKQKLTKNYAYEFQQRPSPLKSHRRPSSSSTAIYEKRPFRKRFGFTSVDQPTSNLYDYRRSSLMSSPLGMSSTSSSGFRFNYPMKKSLDRIRTLTSFDQPSFIIESPRESDGSHSLAANISDRKPSLEDIKETDTSILIESNPNHMSVPEVKTNRRYSYGGETNDNRLKPFRRTRYSADDICRISRIFAGRKINEL